jgi:hypothetical protein
MMPLSMRENFAAPRSFDLAIGHLTRFVPIEPGNHPRAR